ncbi:MAG: nitroreductase family deazaflavin-dependent oxidoreductase [Actinobacteria bacterium]|nr:nitroreductase family deazaflavin-dependent oxidoreductase [Actinomycetota bacterium]
MEIPPEWATESFCYVTTTGRRSGTPHTIEIWFGLAGDSMYLLAEGKERADWVRNMRADPDVTVKVRDVTFPAKARFVDDADEEEAVRRTMAAKYQDWTEGTPMSDWARSALLIALDPI